MPLHVSSTSAHRQGPKLYYTVSGIITPIRGPKLYYTVSGIITPTGV